MTSLPIDNSGDNPSLPRANLMVQKLFPFAQHESLKADLFSEITPDKETAWYVGHIHPHHIEGVKKCLHDSSAIITGHFNEYDLSRLTWDGGVLGELIRDREEAIAKGVRYVPFAAISTLSFNHPTFGVPNVDGARAACIVAEILMEAKKRGDHVTLESVASSTSFSAFHKMCAHYGDLNPDLTEAIFDDNATTAFFQFLGCLDLKEGSRILAFHNTGRVMPDALKGENPRFLKSNFNPNVDIWSNIKIESPAKNIGPFKVDHISAEAEHFASNQEILDLMLANIEDAKPSIIIINTVTRTGRRLQFVDIASAIREKYRDTDYAPVIVLDDAQGLGRLPSQKYLTCSTGRKSESIWDYADAVFFTGAKMVSSLMGAGGVLFNKERFHSNQLDFKDSNLCYRSRKYGFVTRDKDRLAAYNQVASGVANTPELASLVFAMNDLPDYIEIREKIKELRKLVVDTLRSIDEITVIENRNAQYEDSIIAFTLRKPIQGMGGEFKNRLGAKREGNGGDPEWNNFPITIPAIIANTIEGQEMHVLRIGLDSRQVAKNYGEYKRKIQYMLRAIKGITKDLVNESFVSETEAMNYAPSLWPDEAKGIM